MSGSLSVSQSANIDSFAHHSSALIKKYLCASLFRIGHFNICLVLSDFTVQIRAIVVMKKFYFLVKPWRILRLWSIILTVSNASKITTLENQLQIMFSMVMETVRVMNHLQLIIYQKCIGLLIFCWSSIKMVHLQLSVFLNCLLNVY